MTRLLAPLLLVGFLLCGAGRVLAQDDHGDPLPTRTGAVDEPGEVVLYPRREPVKRRSEDRQRFHLGAQMAGWYGLLEAEGALSAFRARAIGVSRTIGFRFWRRAGMVPDDAGRGRSAA